MQEVGRTLIKKIMKTGKETRSYMTYKDVPKDADDWADPKEYLPRRYDLVHLKFNDGNETIGWHTDSRWDGRKFKLGTTVIGWKKTEDLELE